MPQLRRGVLFFPIYAAASAAVNVVGKEGNGTHSTRAAKEQTKTQTRKKWKGTMIAVMLRSVSRILTIISRLVCWFGFRLVFFANDKVGPKNVVHFTSRQNWPQKRYFNRRVTIFSRNGTEDIWY